MSIVNCIFLLMKSLPKTTKKEIGTTLFNNLKLGEKKCTRMCNEKIQFFFNILRHLFILFMPK